MMRRFTRLLIALALLSTGYGAAWAYSYAVTGRLVASLNLTQTKATNVAGVNATVSPAVALNLSYTDGTGDGQIDRKWCRTDSIPASGADTFDLRGGLTDEFGTAAVMAEIAAFAIKADTINTNRVIVGGKFPGHWDTMLSDSSSISLMPGYTMAIGGSDSGYIVTANSADTLILRNSAGSTQVLYHVCIAGRSA
jgi:hypothetical protein